MSLTKMISIALGGTVAVAATVVVAVSLSSASSDGDTAGENVPVEYSTAAATTGDLIIDYEATGTVGPSTSIPVEAPTQGLVLATADLGDVVVFGDIVAIVDDEPVVVVEGDTPMWRDLTVGDEGSDVEQLEQALVGLGFDPDGTVTVDAEYTSATADLVRDWQESVGAPDTGVVGLNDIVVLPSPMRVGSIGAQVGESVAEGQQILVLDSLEQVVTANIAVADAAQLRVGDSVEVRLPDRSTLDGTVSTLTLGSDLTVRTATIEFAEPDGTAPPNGVTTTVLWSQIVAEGATTIPADAFRRLESGAYVIDVLGESGTVTAIQITPGVQVGNNVEVAGVPIDAQIIRP